MLSTAQETAVREWLVAAIADCSELVAVPLNRVLFVPANFPTQAYPRIELRYVGVLQLGADSPQSVDPDTDDLKTRDEDNETLSITFVTKVDDEAPSRNQRASSYLREVKARRYGFVARGLKTAKLAIRDVFAVPSAAVLQGESQWESRAVLDIVFGNAQIVREQPGIIETAGVTGTTTPPTPVRNQLIGA